MGIAMLILAGVGFLINLISIALTVVGLFLSIIVPYIPFLPVRPEQKFANAVHKVMERVRRTLRMSSTLGKKIPAKCMLQNCICYTCPKLSLPSAPRKLLRNLGKSWGICSKCCNTTDIHSEQFMMLFAVLQIANQPIMSLLGPCNPQIIRVCNSPLRCIFPGISLETTMVVGSPYDSLPALSWLSLACYP